MKAILFSILLTSGATQAFAAEVCDKAYFTGSRWTVDCTKKEDKINAESEIVLVKQMLDSGYEIKANGMFAKP